MFSEIPVSRTTSKRQYELNDGHDGPHINGESAALFGKRVAKRDKELYLQP